LGLNKLKIKSAKHSSARKTNSSLQIFVSYTVHLV